MELYDTDLETLKNLLGYVDKITEQVSVFEIEIKVRLDDTLDWVVLGYGEAGDPCVLRFEKDPIIQKPLQVGGGINPFTINKPHVYGGDLGDGGKALDPPLKDYDTRF